MEFILRTRLVVFSSRQSFSAVLIWKLLDILNTCNWKIENWVGTKSKEIRHSEISKLYDCKRKQTWYSHKQLLILLIFWQATFSPRGCLIMKKYIIIQLLELYCTKCCIDLNNKQSGFHSSLYHKSKSSTIGNQKISFIVYATAYI